MKTTGCTVTDVEVRPLHKRSTSGLRWLVCLSLSAILLLWVCYHVGCPQSVHQLNFMTKEHMVSAHQRLNSIQIEAGTISHMLN
jgi:hypothetical protein